MKNFKPRDNKHRGFGGDRNDRGGRGDDKPVFFGKSRGGDRSTDREQRMFKAICSDCKKSCEVPFKPSSDKPVFCRDCFSAKRDRETREYKAGLANGEPKKFGQDKPATHSGSIHSAFVPTEAGESTKKQLAEMNARIDKLTLMLEKMMDEKKEVSVKQESSVKVSAVSVKKVAAKVIPSPKVAKKVATVKPVIAAKKTVTKVVAKKAAPAKKVVAVKKVAPVKPAVIAAKKAVTKVVAKKATDLRPRRELASSKVVAKKVK